MDLVPSPDHADANSMLMDIRLAHLFLDTAETFKDADRKQRFYAMVDRAIQKVAHALDSAPVAGLENVRAELNTLADRFRSAKARNSSAASAG
jgi:hypothetical protein